MLLPYAVLACQLLVAGVFALSSAGKLRDAAAFARSLEPFGIGARARRPLAGALIATELVVVPLVLLRPLAAAGLFLAAGLLIVFAAAIASTVRAGRQVRCRCFGADGAVLRPAHAWRNVALACVALAGGILAATDPAGAIEVSGAVVVAAAATAVLLLLWAFDDVVELLAPREEARA
jgi:Methylamine utilisation protein MauE